MVEPHVVTLRATRAGDLDELYRTRAEPEANGAAAFDRRWAHFAAREDADARTIRSDGTIVGRVVSWIDAETGMAEVAYWIDRQHRGRGIATRAMRLFLDTQPRPVRARAAADDEASVALLTRLGFVQVDRGRDEASGRGGQIEEIEFVLR